MSENLLFPLLQSALESSLGDDASRPATKDADILQSFKNILLMASSDSALTASGSGSLMSPLLDGLAEQLLALQIQNDYQAAGQSSGGAIQGARRDAHINQFKAEQEVGGDGANADCGPTSLVMALHHLGLAVSGETSATNNGQAVDLARKSMATSGAKDGVDAYGARVDAEHNFYTDFSDLARGAAAAGARSQRISPDTNRIRQAVQSGASVIVSGTFAGKSSLPWTGDRGPDNASAPGGATAHIVAITGYNAQTGLFTVHDPARYTSNQVSAEDLQSFMAGNAGAMSIRTGYSL